MKWKVGLLGLILLISLALAFTPGPSKQETKYWDTTNAPTGAVIPIVEQSTPFNVTITDWDTSSLKGKATIQFPVYSKADLASCLIESKVEHLSYFSDKPKLWGSYKGTCTKTSKTVNIPGVGDAKVVECPNVVVGDGVNYINVTCENVAGQASSASTKFIIDKMKPYLDKNSVQVDNWGVTGDANPNQAPKVTFKMRDLSGLQYCLINFSSVFGSLLFDCDLSSSTSQSSTEIKEYDVQCTPVANTLPVEFMQALKGTVLCSDNVGNLYNSSEFNFQIDVGVKSVPIGKLPNVIYRACKLAKLKSSKNDLSKYGFYSISGGGSPELDPQGVITFVYLAGSSPLSNPEQVLVHNLNQRMGGDASMHIPKTECVGSAICSGTIDAIALALTAPTFGASEVELKQSEEEMPKMLRRFFSRMWENYKNWWKKLLHPKKWFKEWKEARTIGKGEFGEFKTTTINYREGLGRPTSPEVIKLNLESIKPERTFAGVQIDRLQPACIGERIEGNRYSLFVLNPKKTEYPWTKSERLEAQIIKKRFHYEISIVRKPDFAELEKIYSESYARQNPELVLTYLNLEGKTFYAIRPLPGIRGLVPVTRLIRGAIEIWANLAPKDIQEVLVRDYDYSLVTKTYTENEQWKWSTVGTVASLMPFGYSIASGINAVTTDIPDIYLKAPAQIKPNVTYMIHASIQRVDPVGGAGDNVVLKAIMGCFDSCPDYICAVSIVPNKNQYQSS